MRIFQLPERKIARLPTAGRTHVVTDAHCHAHAEQMSQAVCQKLSDVTALLTAGELNQANAMGAIAVACAVASASEAGSADQLTALEVLEQCSQLEAGAAAMFASSGCELLLSASVRAAKHSAHQLSAIASLANTAAAGGQEVRIAMVQMGATEVLLSLTSDPELMGQEHQRPALIALANLACEPSNLCAMAQAGTLDVSVMLLSTPAIVNSDLCELVLNLFLAFTVAGPGATDMMMQSGVPISLIHFFMTRPALEQNAASAMQVTSNHINASERRKSVHLIKIIVTSRQQHTRLSFDYTLITRAFFSPVLPDAWSRGAR